MVRFLVGFDPTSAQAAIQDLMGMQDRGVTWRVVNFFQNVNGSEPTEGKPPVAPEVEQDHDWWHRLTGWLQGKEGEDQHTDEAAAEERSVPEDRLTEAEIESVRQSPNRSGMVLLILAPEAEELAVQQFMLRHGAFTFAPEEAA
jgi:hypothetical protein